MTRLLLPVNAAGAVATKTSLANDENDNDNDDDAKSSTPKQAGDNEGKKANQPEEASAPKASSSAMLSKGGSISLNANTGSVGVGSAPKANKKKIQGVLELDWRHFDEAIADGNLWLVEFYAPWCKHCTSFAAAYEAVARQLHDRHEQQQKDGKRKVMVARVDGSAERALSVRFAIHGFPSFFLLDGWTVYDYKGTVTLQGLINFATDTSAAEPIPFVSSPFGPLGQLRMRTLQLGIRSYKLYDHLLKQYDVTSFTAGSLVMGTGLVAGLASILTIGIMVETKHKPE